MFKSQHEQAPIYLSSLCSPLSAVTTRRQLRAATQGDLDYPRTRTVTTYGSRAFAVSRPTCWNLLLSSLKSPSVKPAHVYSARNARIASAVLATTILSVRLSVCPSVRHTPVLCHPPRFYPPLSLKILRLSVLEL